MTLVLMVFAGGLGACLRFMIDGTIRERVGGHFPWGTQLINVLGSALLGALAAGLVGGLDHRWMLIVGTGFCGGFTTLSTSSVEAVRLIQAKEHKLAFAHLIGGAAACIAAAALGYWAATLL